jgi:hypothetical protein
MIVKCGVYGEDRQDRLIFVCHHCGVATCEDHGWVVLADDAFDDSDTPVVRAAMHCPDCYEEHHRGAARQHGWPGSRPTRPEVQAAAVPAPPGARHARTGAVDTP